MTVDLMDRLSEYVDGTLAAAERAQVETWLRTSAAGREAVAELERVKRRAGTLTEHAVPESVWIGVRGEMAGGRADRRTGGQADGRTGGQGGRADEADGRTGGEAGGWARRRRGVVVSWVELAAAAVVLLAVGGGAGWWILGHRAGTQPNVAAVNPTEVRSDSTVPAPDGPADGGVRLASTSTQVDRTYDRAINDLERVVTTNRRQLRPETIRVIRENLARIDSALVRAERALKQDPANPYLYDHLTKMRQRKLDLLQQTANLAAAS